jgi:hypothetical protein
METSAKIKSGEIFFEDNNFNACAGSITVIRILSGANLWVHDASVVELTVHSGANGVLN